MLLRCETLDFKTSCSFEQVFFCFGHFTTRAVIFVARSFSFSPDPPSTLPSRTARCCGGWLGRRDPRPFWLAMLVGVFTLNATASTPQRSSRRGKPASLANGNRAKTADRTGADHGADCRTRCCLRREGPAPHQVRLLESLDP